MLRILRKSNSSGRFWIKIDGTDVRPAQESMSGKWSGDENKGDEHVEELRATYEERKASFTVNQVVSRRYSFFEGKTI